MVNTIVSPSIAIGPAEEKRAKLFERLALFTCVMGFLNFILHSINGAKETPLFDMAIAGFALVCYFIHRNGFYTAARILGLMFLNLIFTVLACALPRAVGMYFYFLPLMVLSISFFGNNQRILRFSFTALPGVLLFLLFLTGFNLIGSLQFESKNENIFFVINLISCAVSLLVCVIFIEGIYEDSEKSLHLLAEEVKTKNHHLEKTNTELDRFLYSTSHDLRSPLMSIKGLVNITRSESMTPMMETYLSMIEERADRLDFFIRDIIDYSKNSRTGLNHECVNMGQLVKEVQQNFQFLEGANDIDFQSDVIPGEIVVDRNRIMIILNNLISNAIKYHQRDRHNPWIRTTVRREGDNLLLTVADNGQGIHSDRKARVFEMFYRATELSQGSGLGLYIVKEAVEKMKGVIGVESVEGEGSCFFVSIPLERIRSN